MPMSPDELRDYADLLEHALSMFLILRRRRFAEFVTQTMVAKEAHVTCAAISRFERGHMHDFSVTTLRRILKAYDTLVPGDATDGRNR